MWRSLVSLVTLVALVALAQARRGLGLYQSEIKLLHKSASENNLQPAQPYVILDGQCAAEISATLFQCRVSGLSVAVAAEDGVALLQTRRAGGELVPRVQVYRAGCSGQQRVDVQVACYGQGAVGRRQRRSVGPPRALPPVASAPSL